MSNKRRRQRELVGEVVVGVLGTLLFGCCAVIIFATRYTISARAVLVDALASLIGREAAVIVLAVASALLALLSLLMAVRAVRLLRNPLYLEAKPPTWEDYM